MNMEQPIRVLCVDDNALVAEAIGSKLEISREFHWLGHLGCADGLLDVVSRLDPDVILLDIDMPGADPFAALAELTEARPEIAVLILSGHVRRDLIDRSIDAGAAGYVSKAEGAAALLPAIRRAARGEFVLGPAISDTVTTD
jgi:DNA-binding NarL/FixJ family response regulator